MYTPLCAIYKLSCVTEKTLMMPIISDDARAAADQWGARTMASCPTLTPQEYRQVHDLWDLVAEAEYRLSEELDAQDEA